jgi:hypothetical protein
MIRALTIERMRPLEDLIVGGSDDAWNQVRAWQAASRRSVEILDCRRADGEAALLAAQVTTRSPMGALALHSGGILIDGGWLRFLGAGNERIGGGLREWNESLGGAGLDPPVGEALLVAYDALGGWFAINGGRWPDRLGAIRYLTPDATGWQSLDVGYSGLLEWSMSDDLDRFYEAQRWPTWQSEVGSLGLTKRSRSTRRSASRRHRSRIVPAAPSRPASFGESTRRSRAGSPTCPKAHRSSSTSRTDEHATTAQSCFEFAKANATLGRGSSWSFLAGAGPRQPRRPQGNRRPRAPRFEATPS